MGDQDFVVSLNGFLDSKRMKVLEKQQYRVVGRHSAVKICHWTKSSIRGNQECYKKKFYDIDCHKCAEVTPAVLWCSNRCGFCWRSIEYYKPGFSGVVDEPKDIIDGWLVKRKALLQGFGGGDVDKERLRDAMSPNHWAISLSGEPTLYPRLGELIRLLKKDYGARSVFLVSNGQEPDFLQELVDKDSLPDQFYVSLNAPDSDVYKKVNRPVHKDFWSRYLKCLDILKSLKGKTRTVLRMTLIRDVNLNNLESYVDLFKRADPDFVEVKGYVHVGFSQRRYKKSDQLYFEEIKKLAERFIELYPEFKILDEMKESKIVLLGKGSLFKKFIRV